VDDKLLALGSAICFGLSPILVKFGFARAGRVDGAVMVALAIAIPVNVALLPFVGGLHWDQVTLRAFAGFAIGGLFGVAGSEVSFVYPITASLPLFTVAFTWLLLRGTEDVGWRTLLGAAAVVGGVVLL